MAKKIKEVKYKGYTGQFQYIQKEEYYYGKIIGIGDLVTFEGNDSNDTINAFHEAVDDYILLKNELK